VENKSKYSASDIACFFINLANKKVIDEENLTEGITNLKLQKLLYFAQAAHCAIFHKPLFSEQILAWQYGPVVEEVYQEYKKYRNLPIPKPNDEKEIDQETQFFLENIWNIFGKYSTAELVNISHSHKPWMDAYQNKTKNIAINVLEEYYKNYFIA